RAQQARCRARRGTPRSGRIGRPLGTHPHLQLPAGARERPPHQSHALQAAAGHRGRKPARADRRAYHRSPGRVARGRERMTVGEARRALAARSRAAGLATPELDARVLVGHALALDHAALVTQADRTLADHETDAVSALAARRLAREPVARIV